MARADPSRPQPARRKPSDSGTDSPGAGQLRFAAGQWVEVRSAAEILATLDTQGALEGLPFMPEMAAFAGRRLRVLRRADKTCVEGLGLRRLGGAVLLSGAACDGAAHLGCERGCLLFFKEAWLKPASDPAISGEAGLTDSTAARRLLARAAPALRGERHHCQSTALADATSPADGQAGLLAADLRGGELPLARLVEILARSLVNRLIMPLGLAELGALRGAGARAPRPGPRLQPGDWVRIRSAGQIRATLDRLGRHRGLRFEPEMRRYLGRVCQVDRRLDRIIHEETGKMIRLADTVTLKGLVCQGVCVKNCPRAVPLYWRAAWLDRIDPPRGGERRRPGWTTLIAPGRRASPRSRKAA